MIRDESLLKIAVLASGTGTTLQAVIDSIEREELGARICVVISNRKDSEALKRAAKAKIYTYVVTSSDPEERDMEIVSALAADSPDLILTLGYTQKIGKRLIARYPMRIINTHPALLPEFGGPGMYGDRVHAAVLEAKKKRSGATLHYILDDEVYDSGQTICQTEVDVEPDDTIEALATRVQVAEQIQLIGFLKAIAINMKTIFSLTREP